MLRFGIPISATLKLFNAFADATFGSRFHVWKIMPGSRNMCAPHQNSEEFPEAMALEFRIRVEQIPTIAMIQIGVTRSRVAMMRWSPVRIYSNRKTSVDACFRGDDARSL